MNLRYGRTTVTGLAPDPLWTHTAQPQGDPPMPCTCCTQDSAAPLSPVERAREVLDGIDPTRLGDPSDAIALARAYLDVASYCG